MKGSFEGTESGANLSLRDSQGRTRISAFTDAKGSPSVFLWDKQLRERLAFHVTDDNEPSVELLGQDGGIRTRLTLLKNGIQTLSMSANDGKEVVSLGIQESQKPKLQIKDPKSMQSISLSIPENSERGASMELADKEGRTTFIASLQSNGHPALNLIANTRIRSSYLLTSDGSPLLTLNNRDGDIVYAIGVGDQGKPFSGEVPINKADANERKSGENGDSEEVINAGRESSLGSKSVNVQANGRR
ncbi:hypothetical protein [Aquisphaera insulae]|uniref:hypothetical protein n=1 Tax=Aquisphaera insulae TaxID=2712864 RepID=UPI0013ED99F4|nr:hypothetical protein [Aquisphaera insulae]